jgi:peptidoglycan/xylan/chitin deacetylase (PgdA/CDA1 family)
MLVIEVPNENTNIFEFVFSNVFNGFLGIDYKLKKSLNLKSVLIRNLNDSNGIILLSSVLLLEEKYLMIDNYKFHNYPLKINLVNSLNRDLPETILAFKTVIGDNYFELTKDGIKTNIDIFALVFFMLSRVEELDDSKLDNHGRFPATASVGYKLSFLDRPIVDEYIELLWSMMKYLWPELKRKETNTKIIVGCDVDAPFDCSSVSISKLIRPLVGDLIKRRNLNQALTRVRRYFSFHRELEINKNLDPFYTFDYYMDVVEKAGLKATFFFIPDSKQPMNGCYDLEDKKILLLIKKLTSRGHSIGLHGSYQSYSDRDILLNGKEKLYSVLNSIGISEPLIKNRQHYLRWDVKTTPDLLEEAGVDIDYSLGYADHTGFRYGTSKQFNLWSWEQNRMLNVIEQPLVIMECSIFDYQELPYNDVTMNYLKSLKQASMNYGGNFHMLWHNSYFMRPNDKEFFEVILSNPE